MPPAPDAVVARLVAGGDPAVRALARDLLGDRSPQEDVLVSPIVRGLLAGLGEPAVLGRPYRKWSGAHWRLVSLVELGVPAGYGPAVRAAEAVLDHWAAPDRLAAVPVVDGRLRMHASQEGNAVAVACRLGLAGDERVTRLVEHLVAGRWPDGGWNCDRHREVRRSSVHETRAVGSARARGGDGRRPQPAGRHGGGRGVAGAPRRVRGRYRPAGAPVGRRPALPAVLALRRAAGARRARPGRSPRRSAHEQGPSAGGRETA